MSRINAKQALELVVNQGEMYDDLVGQSREILNRQRRAYNGGLFNESADWARTFCAIGRRINQVKKSPRDARFQLEVWI